MSNAIVPASLGVFPVEAKSCRDPVVDVGEGELATGSS